MKCEVCGEEHDLMWLHSRCHPDSPTWAVINQVHATIEIRCAECDESIVVLALAVEE